jgi:2'-5' RNA ligase/N-acetylglutamate synthase-like GNAT family acetyltransferase
MAKRRFGVVLLVPAPQAAEIDGLRRALGDGALGRVPPHLTLVPPVNVREDRVAEAIEVLRAAAARTAPFTVHLGPPATFHPVNPVVHLAVEGPGRDEVQAIRDAAFHDPLSRDLSWPFVPHVTLADEIAPARIDAALAALADYSVDVRFDRVHLLEEQEGRVWKPVADVPFAPRAVIGRGGLELELTRSHHLDPEADAWTAREWAGHSMDEYGVVEEDEPFAITARRGPEVVGTAAGTVGREDSYLATLIVRKDERGTGVGSHLLAATEALAAERGCRRLVLRTVADGRARRFYEARGWRSYLTLPAWRRGRDFVQMERVLPVAGSQASPSPDDGLASVALP